MFFTFTFWSVFVSFSIFFSLMSIQLKFRFQNWKTLKNKFSFIWIHACCSWRSLKLYHEVNMFYYMIVLHSHLRSSNIDEIDNWRQINMFSIIFNHFSHFQVIIDWQRISWRREWLVETVNLDDFRNIERDFLAKFSFLHYRFFTLFFWKEWKISEGIWRIVFVV